MIRKSTLFLCIVLLTSCAESTNLPIHEDDKLNRCKDHGECDSGKYCAKTNDPYWGKCIVKENKKTCADWKTYLNENDMASLKICNEIGWSVDVNKDKKKLDACCPGWKNGYSSTIEYYAKLQSNGDETKQHIDIMNSIKEKMKKLHGGVDGTQVNQENNAPSDESVLENSVVNQKNISPSHESDLNHQKKSWTPKLLNVADSSADKLDNTNVSSVDDSYTSSLLLNGEEQSHAVIENDLETENGKVQDPNYIAININNVKNQSEGLADKKKIKQLEKELQDEKQNNINLTLKIKTNDLAWKRKVSELETKLKKVTEKYETLQSTLEASEKHMNNAHIELENKTTEILEKTVSAQSKYNNYDDEDKKYKRDDDKFEEQVKQDKEKELAKEEEETKQEYKKYLEEEDTKEKEEENN